MSSASDCTVLIAASDRLPALKERSVADHTELLAFPDTEALRALEVISRRRPRVVALERLFAETPRGAALINRIRADPTLTRSEIRVVSHDTDGEIVADRPPSTFVSGATASVEARPAAASPLAAAAAGAVAPLLDHHGTRRAPRFALAANVEIDINGSSATLVDLSTCGAQVVSPNVLRPNQRLRIVLIDDEAAVRCNAVVVWASYEMPPNAAPRYRAGVEFLDAPRDEVDAFRHRHQG